MKTIIPGIYTESLRSHKRMKYKWPCVMLVSIVSLFTAGGCASHIYNAEDASLAGKAKEQIVALSKSHQTVFSTMSENLQTMSQMEQSLYSELEKKDAEIYARQVLKMGWDKLQAAFGDVGLASEMSAKIEQEIEIINKELLQAQGKKGRVTASLKDANDELESAKKILSGWNRRVAVLEKLIEVTPSIEQALSEVEDEAGFRKKAEDIVKKVRGSLKDVKVSYSDADGTKQEVDLEDEITKLLDTNDVLRRGDLDSGKIISGINAVVNPKAPGLMVTVALLAKDLADGERKRLLAQIDSLEKRLEVMKRAGKLVDLAKDISLEANSLIPEDIPDGEIVIETLKRLAGEPKPADPEDPDKDIGDPLAGAILATQHYVTIAAPITSQVDEAIRKDAYLQHLQSIELGKINSNLHEALVIRGIEGLVTYHEGGVRPGDIADIAYRVSQLSLLGWIGAKTGD